MKENGFLNFNSMYTQEILSKSDSIISLDIVKQYLRVDGSADDDTVKLTRDFAEYYVLRTCSVSVSPIKVHIVTNEVSNKTIRIDVLPIASIVSVTCNRFTLDPSAYRVVNGRLKLWLEVVGIFDIVAICGYSDMEAVPVEIRTALLTHCAHHYEHRSGSTELAVPRVVDMILSDFTKKRL